MSDDPYLIPGMGTLRNLRGITDPDELSRFEARVSFARIAQLEAGEVLLPGHFDLDHLRAHHRHIFQDVYDWAGELRTVAVAKDSEVFALPQFIEGSAADIFGQLARNEHLRGRGEDRFIGGAAHVLSEINALHPFREGNGRAQRAFLSDLARQAGLHVDWTLLDPERNIFVSVASMHGDETPMRSMLAELTGPRALQEVEPAIRMPPPPHSPSMGPVLRPPGLRP